MKIIKCNDLASKIKNLAKKTVDENNLKPFVVVVKMNEDKASSTYVKRKCETMAECGIKSIVDNVPTDFTTKELTNIVKEWSDNREVTGVIVQLPLPKHIDSFEVMEAIDPTKDLDCLTSRNVGLLLKNRAYVYPATPLGILELLTLTDLSGKNILMIGRSEIVGLPLSVMLQQENATVTLAHSKSEYDVNNYDIVISAIGKGESILVENPNTICIDVGINFKDGRQVGDFDINNPKFNCKWVTSPKGGTGILTSAAVCLNAALLSMEERM